MVKYNLLYILPIIKIIIYFLRSIYVNNRQDYENLNQLLYIVNIRIQDDIVELNINLNNIFDNDPIITYEGPCHAVVSC